jgi:DNA-binding LacI/PurR family transcriptional regulator
MFYNATGCMKRSAMKKKTVHTISDIARLAGVSKSTVSRALNDSPLIGQETRERIQAIAKKNNFKINVPARRLSLKQSNTIAFVTHAYHKEFSVADLFGLEIMGGVSQGLNAHGYDMLVVHVNPHETEWAHQYLDTGRADGFILMTSTRKQNHIHALLEMEAPFIIWGVPPASASCCSVTGDNQNGGRIATQYLISLNRKRIAFLGGPQDEMEVQQRFEGYEIAMLAAKRIVDPALIAYGDFSNTSGAAAMEQLLANAPDLDAVFVNSDLMAIAAMDVIREHGRRVPEDVAVVGYDDLSIAEHSNPPLTTIRQNIPLAGRMLAENLIRYLETRTVTNATIPVNLIMRKSA